MKFTSCNTQQGATLITSLVMLVVLTLLVISAINSSRSNLRIAGNMQMQEEVIAAAQQATEQVLSSNFTAPLALPMVAAPIAVDINNDGTSDYTVNVAMPACTGLAPLTNDTPDLPETCVSSDKIDNAGIRFTSGAAATQTSWCSAQQWDIRTTVSDGSTGATATLHQGVSMNVVTGTPCTVSVPST